MDETPIFESPKPKTHHRERSITTIGDNVNHSTDTPRSSSKTSINSITVRPKSPADFEVDNSEKSKETDYNSNVVKTKYPKEKPQSKVRYYVPNPPVDHKARPLTHSYKYFSGTPPKYRDYKYRDYKGKNNDIPRYKEYKYKEYSKFREYKLTHYNTLWFGGYKPNIPKAIPQKQKRVGRTKKPLKKNGILSAHSLFYPYSEFKYRPYENVKNYKYREYKGYKEYKHYREYKGRQIPISTLYNFIGIWRPLGSKADHVWKRSKLYDPPSREMIPQSEDAKYYDPPERFKILSQTGKDEKVYDPPQRTIELPLFEQEENRKYFDPPKRSIAIPQVIAAPLVTAVDAKDNDYQGDIKTYDPPQRQIVVMSTHTEETKLFSPPCATIIQSSAPVLFPQPIVAESAVSVKSKPNDLYEEELKALIVPEKFILAPVEYVEETKIYEPEEKVAKLTTEYKEESKELVVEERHLIRPREYIEEIKQYNIERREIQAPPEYVEEIKELYVQKKELTSPPGPIEFPLAANIETPVKTLPPEEMTSYEEETKMYAPPCKTIIESYETETKTHELIEKTINYPLNREIQSEYIAESKVYDPQEKVIHIPVEEKAPDYKEEIKLLNLVEKTINAPMIPEEIPYEEETKPYNPVCKSLQEPTKEVNVDKYIEETKEYKSIEKHIEPQYNVQEIQEEVQSAISIPSRHSSNFEEETKEFLVETRSIEPPLAENEYKEEMKEFNPKMSEISKPRLPKSVPVLVPKETLDELPVVESAPALAASGAPVVESAPALAASGAPVVESAPALAASGAPIHVASPPSEPAEASPQPMSEPPTLQSAVPSPIPTPSKSPQAPAPLKLSKAIQTSLSLATKKHSKTSNDIPVKGNVIKPRIEISEPYHQPLESPRLNKLKMMAGSHKKYRTPSGGSSLHSIKRTMDVFTK